MFIDAHNLEGGTKIKGDVCIIGGGVAGITIAREFMNTDLDVVLLESGGFEPNEEIQSLSAGTSTGLPYYDLQTTRTRAFGGTSHRWLLDIQKEHQGVRLRGLDAIDFEKRACIPYSGWPFNKEHLDPFYSRAHELFKIGPYSYKPEDWEKINALQSKPLITDKLKTTFFQFARKNIFYDDYRKEINKSTNISAYLHATVTNIRASESAKSVTRLRVNTLADKEFYVEAKQYILAVGGLENPRLLLLSDDVMKCGIGNQNDLVGRFFMEHPHFRSGIFYPSDFKTFDERFLYDIHLKKGIPIMGKIRLSEEVVRREQLLNFVALLEYEPMIKLRETVVALKNLVGLSKKKFSRGLGHDLKKLVANLDCLTYAGFRKVMGGTKENWYHSKQKYHGFELNLMCEQIPDPESRISLGADTDPLGQRKINLNWKINSEDIRSIRKTQQIIDKELRNGGLGWLDNILPDGHLPEKLAGGWHHMGTTRMHKSEDRGVVNEHGKVHGMSNLFIAGSSVFPTGGYANPTLTIAALSLRLAEHLKQINNKSKNYSVSK